MIFLSTNQLLRIKAAILLFAVVALPLKATSPELQMAANAAEPPLPEEDPKPAYQATLNGQPIPPAGAVPPPAPVVSPTPSKWRPELAANTENPSATPAIAGPQPDPAAPQPDVAKTPAVPAPGQPNLPANETPAADGGKPSDKDFLTDVTTTPDIDPLKEEPWVPSTPMTPSQNVVINLINRLVKKGILSKEEADEMIKQAEADAVVAREQAATQQIVIAQAAADQAATATAEYVVQNMAAQAPPPPDDNTVRVTYVPEIVRNQIVEQVKLDVMADAAEKGYLMPNVLPPWVTNLRPFADIRVRFEGNFFPEGNDNTGAFPNFNAINTGSPFDVAGNQFSPQINVDQDRNRVRLRARFGANMELGEDFTAGIRLATGENNSPVSQNQSLGLANQAQGGNFSKYAIWLDRAFIKYQLGLEAQKSASVVFGRFDNPFFTVSGIQWDDDIGFDGVAGQARYEIFEGFVPFGVGGAFPVFNTDFNFSSNQPVKFKSTDKWLLAGQLGFDWKINQDFKLKVGGAYYYFDGVEGRLSTPYTPLTSQDAGDTDDTRPSFAQKGNTYMALRDIIPDASNDFGTTNQWQYFGLATKFQNASFAGRLDYDRFMPFRVSLSGEITKNLAFNKNDINAIAVNNRGPNDDDLSDTIGTFAGGDLAWFIQLKLGTAALEKRWDWNIYFNYRYVESDSVIDGFAESDFGGGGTNLMGYEVGGHLSLSKNVWVGVKWLSADSVAGPPYKNDIIQFDLSSRF